MKRLDLTNRVFGKLVVIAPATKRDDKYTRWICSCECGKITEVRTDYLTNGHTTSCGHLKDQHFYKLNLVGQTFEEDMYRTVFFNGVTVNECTLADVRKNLHGGKF